MLVDEDWMMADGKILVESGLNCLMLICFDIDSYWFTMAERSEQQLF